MNDPPYELFLAGEAEPVRVVRFRAREGMNRPYSFRLRCVVSEGGSLAGAAIGRPATFVIRFGLGRTRFVQAIVTSSQFRGTSTAGGLVDLVLEPRLARLGLRRARRIYQDSTAVNIVSAVLGEHAVAVRSEVLRVLPVRPYCVQLDESDLEFVERLLADEGIFYFFEHEPREVEPSGDRPPVETVVLADAVTSYHRSSPLPHLVHREESAEGALRRSDHAVFAPRLARRVAGEQVQLSGLDFARPHTTFADSAHAAPSGVGGGAPLARTTHELSYETSPASPGPALVELEQERRNVTRLSARTLSRQLAPAAVIVLSESTHPELCAEWVVISVESRGSLRSAGTSEAVLEASFRAVHSSVPARPRRRARPVCAGLETATVVGPEGEEVHTDGFGRVRVRFPWDGSGTAGEHASTWLRVAQAWAGSGYGAQFIPRVGSEVLVGFVGGDPDRPVVVGGLYDGRSPYPFALPREKTQSGLRTTSVGGQGSNELLFDDKAGGELVSLRGQRNVSVQVGSDYACSVGAASRVKIDGRSELTVGGDCTEAFAGDRSIEVAGAYSETTGFATVRRDGLFESITGSQLRVVRGQVTTIAEQIDVLVGTEGAGRVGVLVSGAISTHSSGTIGIQSGSSITLAVGESKLVVGPSSITLSTPRFRVDAKEIALCGERAEEFVELGQGLRIKSSSVMACSTGATLTLDGVAELKSAQIKLNGGSDTASAAREEASEDAGIVTFQIEDFDPTRNCKVLVMMPNGEIEEKVPDGRGTIQIEGRPGERYGVVDIQYEGRSVAKQS
jgi:type VI secretion system secreted protein VgrG